MEQQLINYLIKPERVGENINLIRNVFEELQFVKIHGLKYAVYRMGENVFVHIVQFETREAQARFMELDSYKAFCCEISSRQMEEPVVNMIDEIASAP